MPKEGTKGKAFTLKTPIIQAYIKHYAMPYHVRPDDCKTDKEFLVMWNLKDGRSLYNYRQIQGFWEAVEKEQDTYKALFIETAMKGLTRLATGSRKWKEVVNKDSGIDRIEEEILPDKGACELLLKAQGKITEKQEVKITGLTGEEILKYIKTLPKND